MILIQLLWSLSNYYDPIQYFTKIQLYIAYLWSLSNYFINTVISHYYDLIHYFTKYSYIAYLWSYPIIWSLYPLLWSLSIISLNTLYRIIYDPSSNYYNRIQLLWSLSNYFTKIQLYRIIYDPYPIIMIKYSYIALLWSLSNYYKIQLYHYYDPYPIIIKYSISHYLWSLSNYVIKYSYIALFMILIQLFHKIQLYRIIYDPQSIIMIMIQLLYPIIMILIQLFQ
jgi:hypothetical protein